MLSIGEFARLVGVSVRMLRHYDQLGLLPPASVDEFSGYRYYSATQLGRANQLVAMKELGFTLEQVGELLDDGVDAAKLVQMLCQRRSQLTDQIRADQARLAQVEAKLRLIQEEPIMSTTTRSYIQTDLPELHLVGLTSRVTAMEQIADEIGPMFERVDAAVTASSVERVGPSVGHYTADDDGVRIGAGDQVSSGPVPDGLEPTTLAAATTALTTTYTEPDLGGLQQAWQELVAEVERRGLTPSGTCREIYVASPFTGAGGWVVELQQPLA